MTEKGSQPEKLAQDVKAAGKEPPVESWNPPLSGEMDMRIAANGDWYYRGSRLKRHSMVKLFSTILRIEDDGCYYLVTPVEKFRIRVDDAPFVAHSLSVTGSDKAQRLTLVTNVGDEVTLGEAHPLIVEIDPGTGEPRPYVPVKRGLRALVERADFYRLVDLAREEQREGRTVWGVWSDGSFFPVHEGESAG